MIFTHVVDSEGVSSFDINEISKYEKYIFIVTPLREHYDVALNDLAGILASSKYLIFLLNEDGLSVLGRNRRLSKIFAHAADRSHEYCHSYACVLSRKNLSAGNFGEYYGMYLSLRDKDDVSDVLRSTVVKLLREEAVEKGSADVYKLIGPVFKLIGGFLGGGPVP